MFENPFYHYHLGFNIFYSFTNTLSTCNPIFALFNWERPPGQTVQPTKLEKKPPSYLAVDAGTSNFIFHLQCSGCVQPKKWSSFGRGKYFYKSEKTSGQTVRSMKIKKVALLYLVVLPSLQTFFCSFYNAVGISFQKLKLLH